MTGRTCPHGFAEHACEICRVMGGGTATPARRSPSTPGRRRARVQLRVGTAAIVAVVGVIVVLQALAVVSAALRVLQFAAVAGLAGWLGWTLGVAHGRRRPR